MKNIKLLLIFFIFLGAIACQEEDLDIIPKDPKYDLSDSDTDELQHLKYKFNQDYGVIVIDDVDSSDYLYTMTSEKLDRIIGKCLRTDEEKVAILKALESTFYTKYPQSFIKKYAPLKLILADSVGGIEKRMNWETWQEEDTYVSGPLFVNKTIVALATNNKEMQISEDGQLVTVLNEYGDKVDVATSIISKVVLENILKAQYGENWDQLFLTMFGKYQSLLYKRDWDGLYDSGIRIDFGDDYFDPADPVHLLKRPLAEYPGVKEEYVTNEDWESVKAYLYGIGFPAATQVRYFNANPHPEWGYPASGRVKIWVDVLIPAWIEFAGLYTEVEKQALFALYPELENNYLRAKELLLRYAEIEI